VTITPCMQVARRMLQEAADRFERSFGHVCTCRATGCVRARVLWITDAFDF
jgi:hypothetical protein